MSTWRTARGGGDGLVSPDRRYPLELDQTEVERYRTMAEAARQAEADLWEPAGIMPGARVADVGCGPGAMLPALAAAVGPEGPVVAVDADPEAVAAATALVAAAGLANVTVQQGRAEATSRGAALLALERLGALPSVAAARAPLGEVVVPDPARHARYAAALVRHRWLDDRV